MTNLASSSSSLDLADGRDLRGSICRRAASITYSVIHIRSDASATAEAGRGAGTHPRYPSLVHILDLPPRGWRRLLFPPYPGLN